MASNAVLNIRLPEELKKHGNQVLERNGKSISQVVRDLYEYMASEQELPPFARRDCKHAKFEDRRKLLKNIGSEIEIPEGFDLEEAKRDRIMEKYGERE